MRPPIVTVVLAGCLFAATGASQEVKKGDITYDMAYMEKVFALKLTATRLEPGKTKGDTLLTMTLEFMRDSPPSAHPRYKALSVAYLQSSFGGKEALYPGGRPGKGKLLKCYFFDEAGVTFATQPPGKIQGELTGTTGDAFRITQSVPDAVLAKTKKISFREEPIKKK